MSVLEKIRSKTALLVGIIGLALLIFVLQSALETGNSLFGTNERTVGRIAGKNIDYNDFLAKYNVAVTNFEQSGQKLDDQSKQTLIDQVWNEFISERIQKSAYKKVGVSVGEDELYDLMVAHPHQIVVGQLTDRQTGKVYPNFAKADGTIDPAKLQGFVQQMTPEQEKYWKKVEDYVRDTRMSEKYNNLLKKGLYITTAEAKTEYDRQGTSYNVDFVAKRYSAVSDSAIQVSEDDLKNYYNENSYKFQNFETTRKIEYVTFDAFATQEDIDDIKKQMAEIAVDFKNKKNASEDSALMQSENENGTIDIGLFKKSMISPEIDSSIFTAEKGNVYGPIQENSLIKVVKLIDKVTLLDSAKVRHILISYAGGGASADVKRTKEQAKKLADSLLVLLKKDLKQFATFVKDYSDDGGKKMPPNKKEGEDYMGKDGNYGWMNDNTGFVEPFKNFGLQGKKGNLGVVETQFGYHIMEVLDVSKNTQTKYKLASISRKIQPSEKTLNTYNLKSSEFAGKYNTAELFTKGCEEQKLVPRLADNIREGDKQVPGLENPKELVRWVYAAKKGDVSTSFQFGNRFVVARLSEIKEKGTAPFDQVKDDVTFKAKQDKKAQQFMKELGDYLATAKTADELASKMKLRVEKANDLVFNSYSVAGLGKEDVMCGAVSVLKPNTPSKPLKGTNAAFVFWVTSKKDPAPTKDYKASQRSANMTLSSRADYEAFEAMKTMANIEDHKAKFDF
ncbi:MAG TPA: SurA N-terminal domain-containing protein [Bacteroidia bacterium]|jgi:peptidyl-prolyl cis-trans isomerase D|nr:SurA N-terminal domain-containing protein [Bacteroidia bacterium]